MTFCAVEIAWIIALAGGVGTTQPLVSQAASELRRTIERDSCSAEPDDFGQIEHQRRIDDLRALGQPARDALLTLARSRRASAKCALRFLVELGDRRAIPMLRKIATTPDASTGDLMLALWGLGLLGDVQSVSLIASFLQHSHPAISESAINALGFVNDDRARVTLRALLSDTQYISRRYLLLRAIGRQRDAAATTSIASIIQAAALPEDYLLVAEGVIALIRIRTPDSVAAAQAGLTSVAGPPFRSRILNAARRELRMDLTRTEEPSERRALQSLLERLDTWR